MSQRDYTGLGAAVWDVLAEKHDPGDVALFRRRLRTQGKGRVLDVLDVGCGSGRTMRPLLRDGHRVTGIDVSADQIRYCRQRLDEAGFTASLHAAAIEQFETDDRYDAVLVPCGTLQLLDPAQALRQGLTRIAALLRPGGLLLAACFLEGANLFDDPTQVGRWVQRGRGPARDGSILVKHARVEAIDWPAQRVTVTLRYQRLAAESDDAAARVIEEQTITIHEHWYSPHEISMLAAAAGFEAIHITGGYDDRPTRGDDRTFVISARCV